MKTRLNKNTLELLKTLADYRILTPIQITILHFQSRQLAYRAMRDLAKSGLVESATRGFGSARGRPESVLSLSQKGIELLRNEGALDPGISHGLINGQAFTHTMEHHLLLNWFRIHVAHIEKVLPDLSNDFISSISPFHLNETKSRPLVYEPSGAANPGENGFTPDGVFTIGCSERKETLLFFLEIDMGTEPLVSQKSDVGSVRQKISTYQDYFRQARYKRYEDHWQAKLEGFRLLFLAPDLTRLTALCRQVRSQPPSDFIWVTDQERMFVRGLADAIWARGGKEDIPPQSILNSRLCRPSPIPLPKPYAARSP